MTLALALVAAACGGTSTATDESSPTTTATTATSATTSTTSSTSTTTTTTVSAPIPIFPTTNFDADKLYEGALAGGFAYRLEFADDGWEVDFFGAELQEFIHFVNRPSDAASAEVGLVLFDPTSSVSDVVEFFANHENVAEATTPVAATVGDLRATTLDVLVEPDPLGGGARANSACQARVFLADDRAIDGTRWFEEVLGCAWSRIWVIDVDGVTVTIYGSRWFEELDPETIAELEPVESLLDDFVNAITFCTEATPCDG